MPNGYTTISVPINYGHDKYRADITIQNVHGRNEQQIYNNGPWVRDIASERDYWASFGAQAKFFKVTSSVEALSQEQLSAVVGRRTLVQELIGAHQQAKNTIDAQVRNMVIQISLAQRLNPVRAMALNAVKNISHAYTVQLGLLNHAQIVADSVPVGTARAFGDYVLVDGVDQQEVLSTRDALANPPSYAEAMGYREAPPPYSENIPRVEDDPQVPSDDVLNIGVN